MLSLARKHFLNLKKEFGDSSIEYRANDEYPQAFPRCRLLNRKPYETLCESICQDILKGKASEIKFLELRNDQIEHVKNFVLNPEVDSESREMVFNTFGENSLERKILFILRGYFYVQHILRYPHKKLES